MKIFSFICRWFCPCPKVFGTAEALKEMQVVVSIEDSISVIDRSSRSSREYPFQKFDVFVFSPTRGFFGTTEDSLRLAVDKVLSAYRKV